MQSAKNKDLLEFQNLHDAEFLAFITPEEGVITLCNVFYGLK